MLGVGLDLGLPTGVLAACLARRPSRTATSSRRCSPRTACPTCRTATVAHQLAVHLAASRAVVSNGYPPYGLYEFPPPSGKIPPHRTDAGAFLLADAYGAAAPHLRQGRRRRVHQRPGINRRQPSRAHPSDRGRCATGPQARTLPIDALVLQLMAYAKHQKEIQIVNGLTPGNVTKALHGEHVGTIVHAD